MVLNLTRPTRTSTPERRYIEIGIEAYHAGAGGIAGSEGAIVLILEGEDAKVAKAFEFAKSIKGEKPLNRPYGIPVQAGVEKPLSAKAGA
jgi:hypothetical protein